VVFLVILEFFMLLVVSSILKGYVLSILWGWFIVPVFSLPELTVVSAIGIAIVVSYLTHQYNENKGEGKSFDKRIAIIILRPFFVLLFGWVVHLFM